MPKKTKKAEWVNFYGPDGKCLGGFTVEGMFSGEVEATKELLAAENGLATEDIEVRCEGS